MTKVVDETIILVHETPPYQYVAEVFIPRGDSEPSHLYCVRQGMGGAETSIYKANFDPFDRVVKIDTISKHADLPHELAAAFTATVRSIWLGCQITFS